MLHSTFWNHGAGALDLPPWAVSMLLRTSNLPLNHDNDGSSDTRSRGKTQPPVASDGVFLDFLYPPQALAWLQRASAQQQLQKWERRNTRRLPDGFVVASRGYASKSYRRDANASHAVQGIEDGMPSSGNVYTPFASEYQEDMDNLAHGNRGADQSEQPEWAYDQTNRKEEQHTSDALEDTFAISPGDLAESTPNNLSSLRNLLRFNRGKSVHGDSETSRKLAERAWTIYQALDDDTREDQKLKRELLEWYAMHSNDIAASRCEQLFQSIPTGLRTLDIYNAMLSMYVRLENFDSAKHVHHESLQTLENGHVVSKRLFEYAVEHGKWNLAIQTATQHHSRYTELNQQHQIQLFWLHVSEMPQSIDHAMELYDFVGKSAGLEVIDPEKHAFVSRFFKEAIMQLPTIVRSQRNGQLLSVLQNSEYQQDLPAMVRFVLQSDDNFTKLLEDLIFAFLGRYQSEYAAYHALVSSLFQEHRKLPDGKPSPNLLGLFIYRLSYFEPHRNVREISPTNVTSRDIMDEWKRFYEKPDAASYRRLVETTAYAGRVEEHDSWMREFRSYYTSYHDWKDSLWTLIYLYARRANLDMAQQAFATISRIMGEHGDEPDLRCWSALLSAHGRADDLEGAFTNFQSLTEKLTPNETCFAPILLMLARRGDVDGVEDFLEQFDEMVGAKRSTLMTTRLIEAHIHQGSVDEAESILRDTIQQSRDGEVTGPLFLCFNAILKAHAKRHDLAAVMKIYKWMTRENVRLNSHSFSAVLMALVNLRRHEDALRILQVEMKEHGIEPTAFHYAIIMDRLVENTDYKRAIAVHEEMTSRNIRPSVATNALYIKAKTWLEHNEKRNHQRLWDRDRQPESLESSIAALEKILEGQGGDEAAASQADFLVGMADNTTADPGPYFETLISVHGKRGCFEAVKALFARYQEAAKGRGGDESKLPINLTSSLMSAHWYAGEYDQVEEYWKLAKARADEVSSPVPVPSFRYLVSEKDLEAAEPFNLRPIPDDYSRPGSNGTEANAAEPNNAELDKQTLLTDTTTAMKIRPAPRRRYILNQPLRWYLAALCSQARIIDAIQTVSRLLTQGYAMDKPTWNLFICQLLDTTPPLALVAFTLTERFLITGFPGWVRKSKRDRDYYVPRRARYEGLEYINARYVEPGRLMPHYKTLVRLGAALLDVRRLEVQGRRGVKNDVPPELQKFIGTTRDIRLLAAKTLHVVQSIPYITRDKWQAKYLGR